MPASSGSMLEVPNEVALALVSKKDVDHLVKELKENLKLGHQLGQSSAAATSLSGGGKMTPHYRRSRPSPYGHVPPSSRVSCDNNSSGGSSGTASAAGCGDKTPSQLKRWNQRRRYPSTCMAGGGPAGAKGGADPDDPFQMLQELITDGSLIKEAVRRLQLGLTPKYKLEDAGGASGADDRSFYDSDDECRTPPAYPDEEEESAICCQVGGGL